ncbi:DUF2511 domain-containing protein [Rhodococcus sp. 1R11]|uniref:DUF2511 domain-containing protein n=1 Tax=Rhodococcus sp. 1R11 TaxID=2559614 RepID=UPI001071D8F9|nr:DUF2511 domain-containing protein [Rhodococcus sp. 1R11]TFI45157.1 DUF2511 domain-containing protein [Rhodococcus sp. 1R11]
MWIAGSALVVLALSGCSDSGDSATPSTPETTVRAAPITSTTAPAAAPATTAEPTARNVPAGLVSESTWTGDWPFTVPEGSLMCGQPNRVTFTADGTIYALNGAAKSAGAFDDVAAIWKESDFPGVRVDIGPMIQRGLELC